MPVTEESFGIIPLQKRPEGWFVLLVCHKNGHWTFPKGHSEANETPQEAAIRELKEETGLEIDEFVDMPSMTESYRYTFHGAWRRKTVTYFPALVSGTLVLQAAEISGSAWLPFGQAEARLTYPEARRLLQLVTDHIKEHHHDA